MKKWKNISGNLFGVDACCDVGDAGIGGFQGEKTVTFHD